MILLLANAFNFDKAIILSSGKGRAGAELRHNNAFDKISVSFISNSSISAGGGGVCKRGGGNKKKNYRCEI